MNVLFVSHDSSLFGAQRMLLTLLSGIDRTRFIPHLISPNDGALIDAARSLGIPAHLRHMVRWVPSQNEIKRRGRLRHLCELFSTARSRAWAIASIIERDDIDLVYTNTVTCIEGALAAQMCRIPHVWHIHEPTHNNPELKPLFPSWIYTKLVDKLSNTVIFPGQAVAGCYRLKSSVGRTIYNGLKFSHPTERKKARQLVAARFGIDPGLNWIGNVGAIHPRKDHATLIRAAEGVVSRHPRAHFLIIGAGPPTEIEQLSRLIKASQYQSNIHALGPWKGDISEVMSAIDILAVSSRQESFGLTIIEALSAAVPVVATRCGGPQEIISHGRNGLLVPVGDPAAMADAICTVLDAPDFAGALAARGQIDVLQKFERQRYVSNIQDVIAEVIKANTNLRQ